jgi:hypothetical protein
MTQDKTTEDDLAAARAVCGDEAQLLIRTP